MVPVANFAASLCIHAVLTLGVGVRAGIGLSARCERLHRVGLHPWCARWRWVWRAKCRQTKSGPV